MNIYKYVLLKQLNDNDPALLHSPFHPSIITTNIKREEVLTMTSAIESNIRTNNNGRAGSASVA